ncbi:MAG: ArsR/SmtB family transcription factor [Opitutales bacterium]
MSAAALLRCIADPQRLRILNLLAAGPLCVCHLQGILGAPQVKISKQLATMKQAGLIRATREGTWMIYRLEEPTDGLLQANLNYLRQADCHASKALKADLQAREKLVRKLTTNPFDCPEPVCETIRCR